MNIIEKGVRQGVTFDSGKGQVSMVQLFRLPLTSTNGVSLDSISKPVMAALNNEKEVSLVATPSAASAVITLKKDILEYVIASKRIELADAVGASAKKARRQELLALQDNANKAEDAKLTPEEIQKELDEL